MQATALRHSEPAAYPPSVHCNRWHPEYQLVFSSVFLRVWIERTVVMHHTCVHMLASLEDSPCKCLQNIVEVCRHTYSRGCIQPWMLMAVIYSPYNLPDRHMHGLKLVYYVARCIVQSCHPLRSNACASSCRSPHRHIDSPKQKKRKA